MKKQPVLITDAVRATVERYDHLAFEDIGQVKLKGFSEATELFLASMAVHARPAPVVTTCPWSGAPLVQEMDPNAVTIGGVKYKVGGGKHRYPWDGARRLSRRCPRCPARVMRRSASAPGSPLSIRRWCTAHARSRGRLCPRGGPPGAASAPDGTT